VQSLSSTVLNKSLCCSVGNVKQAVLPQPAESVFVEQPNQNEYFATEDITTNSSTSRPFFYQVEVLSLNLLLYS
jgi:hypothetical protein